jgi:hypothetical protein
MRRPLEIGAVNLDAEATHVGGNNSASIQGSFTDVQNVPGPIVGAGLPGLIAACSRLGATPSSARRLLSGRVVDEGIVEFRVHGAQHETYYDSEIYAVYDGGALLPSGGFDCCERRS